VKVITHEDISIDGEAPGLPCFIKGFAGDDFDSIRAEHW